MQLAMSLPLLCYLQPFWTYSNGIFDEKGKAELSQAKQEHQGQPTPASHVQGPLQAEAPAASLRHFQTPPHTTFGPHCLRSPGIASSAPSTLLQFLHEETEDHMKLNPGPNKYKGLKTSVRIENGIQIWGPLSLSHVSCIKMMRPPPSLTWSKLTTKAQNYLGKGKMKY